MRIYLINPNTTESMTLKAASAARTVAADGTEIIATQPTNGPASIEGFYDEAFSIPGLIGELQKAEQPDGVVLACFDDTGLDAARCIMEVPVVGIGEAGFHMASLVSNKFGVVTTLARSIAAIEHNLVKYGLMARCAGVRASDIPVLGLEDPASNARSQISEQIRLSLEVDGADAIVLGCAGMTDLASALQQEHGVPVIDGVVSAVKLVEGLVATGIKTSKSAGYAEPITKVYSGDMKQYSPN